MTSRRCRRPRGCGRSLHDSRQGRCNSCGRFAAGMHALGQSHLRLVQCLRATDGLAACPPCVPRCCAAFAAWLQRKRGEAGALLARRCPRKLVAVYAIALHARRCQRIDLLVQALVLGAHPRISELSAGSGGSCPVSPCPVCPESLSVKPQLPGHRVRRLRPCCVTLRTPGQRRTDRLRCDESSRVHTDATGICEPSLQTCRTPPTPPAEIWALSIASQRPKHSASVRRNGLPTPCERRRRGQTPRLPTCPRRRKRPYRSSR